ncbi:hypothetical protein BO70DRAFT_432577 [Aspergillus heteromorphus CBS 117.55]|uniref:Uncharacterized protein n=1 Tax=Aspergillus heteromorphus CBS 117.55 TaxID=1448321 RepID=A0A317V509_9EURO|nr:uncharacterized protein BO70DRAFT_432577 [Aspergillus heteromorphus CBS 117.55]PWY69076.1 hypothetical protein BO70DRAFT_432577 [Aspergillus heteromorphus CBS 117.55]
MASDTPYLHPISWLESHVAGILDKAGVPSFIWGDRAMDIYDLQDSVQSLRWVIPDAYINQAGEALVSAGFVLQQDSDLAPAPDYQFEIPAEIDLPRRLPVALDRKSRLFWTFPDPPVGPPEPYDDFYTVTSDVRFYWRFSDNVRDRPIFLVPTYPVENSIDFICSSPLPDDGYHPHPYIVDSSFQDRCNVEEPFFLQRHQAKPFLYSRLGPNNPSPSKPVVKVKVPHWEKYFEAMVLLLLRDLPLPEESNWAKRAVFDIADGLWRWQPRMSQIDYQDIFDKVILQIRDARSDSTLQRDGVRLRTLRYLKAFHQTLKKMLLLPLPGSSAPDAERLATEPLEVLFQRLQVEDEDSMTGVKSSNRHPHPHAFLHHRALILLLCSRQIKEKLMKGEEGMDGTWVEPQAISWFD